MSPAAAQKPAAPPETGRLLKADADRNKLFDDLEVHLAGAPTRPVSQSS